MESRKGRKVRCEGVIKSYVGDVDDTRRDGMPKYPLFMRIDTPYLCAQVGGILVTHPWGREITTRMGMVILSL